METILLPSIKNKIIKRPGFNVPKSHYIPNDKESDFWKEFYLQASKAINLKEPVINFKDLINPYFGKFGMRWHPTFGRPHYFHIGIDISAPEGTQIRPIANGLLDYSGFAKTNGNYIIIRHPHIVTEDKFTLHSLYMHCESLSVKFSFPQKLLRRFVSTELGISNLSISQEKVIGTVGGTGHNPKYNPHLHLQLEFISEKRDIRVAVDPIRMYGFEESTNLTATLNDINDFKIFYKRHSQDMTGWRKFIETYMPD